MGGRWDLAFGAEVRHALVRAVLDGEHDYDHEQPLSMKEAAAAAAQGKLRDVPATPREPGMTTIRDWLQKEKRRRAQRDLEQAARNANGPELIAELHTRATRIVADIITNQESRETVQPEQFEQALRWLERLSKINVSNGKPNAPSEDEPAMSGESALLQRVNDKATARESSAGTTEPKAEKADAASETAANNGTQDDERHFRSGPDDAAEGALPASVGSDPPRARVIAAIER